MLNPKKNRDALGVKHTTYGRERRFELTHDLVEGAPVFPKPLEFADIDDSFKEFIEQELEIITDGKKVPTFTLFSNQRFSEYSQTWQHTDKEGNLILNFKTIVRKFDPMEGTNQGSKWNIPGDRRYKLHETVEMDDNGVEHYAVYSMKQPYTVDLNYVVNFVTDKYAEMNKFISMVYDLFKARQQYIVPNGHYIPMLLQGFSDETQYTIDDRKFFNVSCSIKVLAYIIHEEDFKKELYPKRQVTIIEGVTPYKKKANVEIEEVDEGKIPEFANVGLKVNITFPAWCERTEFTFDTEMVVEYVDMENVRTLSIHVNGDDIYYEKGFALHEGDSVKLKIRFLDDDKPAYVRFNGYEKEKWYRVEDPLTEDYGYPATEEEIDIEGEYFM